MGFDAINPNFFTQFPELSLLVLCAITALLICPLFAFAKIPEGKTLAESIREELSRDRLGRKKYNRSQLILESISGEFPDFPRFVYTSLMFLVLRDIEALEFEEEYPLSVNSLRTQAESIRKGESKRETIEVELLVKGGELQKHCEYMEGEEDEFETLNALHETIHFIKTGESFPNVKAYGRECKNIITKELEECGISKKALRYAEGKLEKIKPENLTIEDIEVLQGGLKEIGR